MKKKEKLRRKLLIFLLTLVMVVGLMPGMSMTARADGPYGGGDGTENNPYAIETLEHLQQLKERVNNGTNYEGTFFILKNSISISDSEWTPIGTATCTTYDNSWSISAGNPFQGTFDGNNNEISGLSITGDKNVQGLFGYVGNNGKVKNLIVSGSVKGNVLIGGIVGYNKGTVSGCHNKVAVGAKGLFHDRGNNAGGGGVVGTNEGTVKGCTNSGLITGITAHETKKGCYKDGTNIGGVVGGNSGTVTECWNTGTVNAAGNTGGVLGANYGTLSKSYNAGDVAGTSWSVAGLLGINRSGGFVENCYNTGTLNSTGVGNSGIVGTQQSWKDIKNCYNYGTVKLGDGENYGQIIGGGSGKTPSYCYYPSNLASVKLNTNGGSPLSDEQFAKKESFSGWDFSDVWYLDNGVRPLLKAIPETIPNKPGFEYDTEKKKLKITVDSEDTTIYYTKNGKRPEVTSETIQNGETIDDLEGGETINVILMKENAVLMSTSYVCPYTVTYKVVNGTWSDDSTADKTEAVVSGLKPASVPTGMKASEGFAGGEWDEDPSNTTITEGKIFTYTFTAKATVTEAPTSKDPTYTGEPQGIIYPGTANGGTIQYVIGINNSEPPTDGWSESIPTATEAGTYYVWYKAVGDETHTDSEAKCITVTISSESSGGGGGSSSSGGGSSTPSTPTTPTESYTVPVSCENTVNVTTNISNGTAVVSEITQSDIDKIVDNGNNSGGGDNTEASENTSITIDLSQAKSEVTSVQLTKETVEKLTEAVNAHDNLESVEIKMSKATVELDGKALSAVSEQAEGSSIKLVVKDTQTTKLNASQQESLKQFTSAQPFQAYFESKGKEIHDFKGGKATVSIKFSPETGKDVKYYHMYYLPLAGAIERYETRYIDGMLNFVTGHFSDYAIVYDETRKNETGKEDEDDNTDTDDNNGTDDGKTTEETSETTANGKTAYQNALSINKGLKVSQTGNKITVSWGKVSGADRYEIYAAYCTDKFGKKPVKIITKKDVTSVTITKLNGKKLVLTKNFKAYVVAYKTVDGSKKKLGKTITAHIVGRKNKTYTNVKAIKLAKNKTTIKVGKTYKIKASVVLADSKKKMLSDKHAATFRYASSNKKIAAVDKNGKVIAKKVGTCYIWVYAKNGYAKKVKITVK